MEDLTALKLTDFVHNVGNASPAPGSGAAAAVSLALGAACVAKAFAITYKHLQDDTIGDAAQRAHELAFIAVQGAQRDAEDFQSWLKSHKYADEMKLDNDAAMLYSIANDIEALIDNHGGYVVEALIPDLDAAKDLINCFLAIETRNQKLVGA